MALDLTALTTKQAVSAIFIGYYDRAPAPNGLNYWVNDIEENGFTLADVARAFAVQQESQDIYPALGTEGSTNLAGNVAFVTAIFQNLFGREPNNITENGGADNFWVNALQNGADVGRLILDIMSGAQGNDLAILENKIEVAVAYSDASEAAGILGRQNLGNTIIDDVTASDASVAAALSEIEAAFAEGETPEPTVPGEQFFLTSGTDVITGTADDDEFYGFIAQNPFAGGISNTLSSADRLDGGAGDDRLYAEITSEFLGVSSGAGGAGKTDIQPRLTNIEDIDFEARDVAFDDDFRSEGHPFNPITVDAKNINGHNEIGSFFSDGDLLIENLTTLASDGVTARNTSDITITMVHTDNFNSDGDASDLVVYFDNDYLLAGQTSVGTADFFLLDQDAELRIQNGQSAEGRLDQIDKNGIRFEINGQVAVVSFDGALLEETNTAEINSHEAFIAALQAPLQALIDAGTLPTGTQIVIQNFDDVLFDDEGLALNRAGLQDGSFSALIPSVRVISGDGSPVTPLGFVAPVDVTGAFNVFGRFDNDFDQADEPVSINIELEKVGRGGDGGDLIIGGKQISGPTQPGIEAGIEVFNVDVLGADNKPSSLGTLASTQGVLRVVNIATAAAFLDGDSFASLEIREGFGSSDMELVNANAFRGDLRLGTDAEIEDLQTLTALGGGDVEFYAEINGDDVAYSYTTGSGDDLVDIIMSGDALDFNDSELLIDTGAGDDVINALFTANPDSVNGSFGNSSQQLNQAVLNNVQINGGSGDDVITVNGVGNANIFGGDGDDIIYTAGTAGEGSNTIWALNFDNLRADAAANNIGSFAPDELPGVQTSLAYVGGATITVTLSGAGIASLADGGGVMALGDAIDGENGYESTAIVTVAGPLNHYGTQADVNAAIIAAIDGDAVLSALLTVIEGANNTLAIVSTTSGNFAPTDLRIDIAQLDAATAAAENAVLAEAQRVFQNSDLTAADLFSGGSYRAGAPGADLTNSVGANAWFDGLSVDGEANSMVDNLHTSGSSSSAETDNTINGGAGDDIIVLSTDANLGVIPPFTAGGNNALINGASNETVVMDGPNFGNDTIMNFTTRTLQSTGSADGLDFLDFTAYLTSETSSSGSANSSVEIDVTLDYAGGSAAPNGEIEANEVVVITYTDEVGTAGTFGSLSAADIEGLFEGDNFDGNALQAVNFNVIDLATPTAVVGGVAKAILMVENAGNLGEYKVFELTWDASEPDGDEDVSATLVGSLDFGTSLDGLDEVNLVGSVDYNSLLQNGF